MSICLEIFVPGWINCLDNYMMKWINQFKFTVFLSVPYNPWRFSNDFHTIACGVSDILFTLDWSKARKKQGKSLTLSF